MQQTKEFNAQSRIYPKWEIVFYFSVYISYLIYGLSELLSVRDEILALAKFPLGQGWSIFNRPRDDSNDELENFTLFLNKNCYWYVLHLLMSAALRIGWLRRPGLAFALLSAAFLVTTFRLFSVIIIAMLLLSYYALSWRSSKPTLWTLSTVWIILINVIKNSNTLYEMLGYDEYFTLVVLLSWTMLRCCSFNINKINHIKNHEVNSKYDVSETKSKEVYSIENYLGYTLYFPTLIYGPFLSFPRYIVVNDKDIYQKNGYNLKVLLKELLRLMFWWTSIYTALHFLYIHYMERDVDAVKLIKSSYSHYAIGYFMGQFFYLYYVLTYGLGIAIARFDGLNPPKKPRCIGRIHFYSDMWKFFDEGLYEFLFNHIYAELCTKHSKLGQKLIATAATFTFIFVWHGCYQYVLIWSLLNFVCLIAEKLFRWLTSSTIYFDCVTRRLGFRNSQRLQALLATQIFIPAAFSNVYFISGSDVGYLLMHSAYCSGVCNYLTLTFCSYCFFQCSEVISKLGNAKK